MRQDSCVSTYDTYLPAIAMMRYNRPNSAVHRDLAFSSTLKSRIIHSHLIGNRTAETACIRSTITVYSSRIVADWFNMFNCQYMQLTCFHLTCLEMQRGTSHKACKHHPEVIDHISRVLRDERSFIFVKTYTLKIYFYTPSQIYTRLYDK